MIVEGGKDKTMTRILNWLIAIALTLVPAVASAHVGVGDVHGFVHDLSHPLSGNVKVLITKSGKDRSQFFQNPSRMDSFA
jgi:hypothetical protein